MTTAPDTAPDLLAFARERRRARDGADADVFMTAAAWADQHAADSVAPALADWDEKALPLAGEGTPEVAEFCIAEFAAGLDMTTHAGRALIGDALETRHRLPKVWARIDAGTLEVWRARQIAHLTIGLPPAGAAYVDDHVAAFAHRIGYAALQRLLEEAKVRFLAGYEPDCGPVARDGRKVKVGLGQMSTNGTADIWGELGYADACDFERAIARRAEHLGHEGEAGEGLDLDVRRSLALGEMARDDLCLDLETGERTPRQGGGVEVKVHINADDLASDDSGQPQTAGLARVEGTGGNGAFMTLAALRAWLQRPGVRISMRTVIDTTATIRVDQWEIPDRLRRQIVERDGTSLPPLQPPRPRRRPRPHHALRHRPRRIRRATRPDRLGQPGRSLPDPSPAQDICWLELHHARAGLLPLALSRRLPVPRHALRHPGALTLTVTRPLTSRA